MGSVVRKVFQVAAVAVNFVPGIGQVASALITAGLAVGSSLLAKKPNAPQNSPENINRLRANVNPLTPRKTVIGVTAMEVDIR